MSMYSFVDKESYDPNILAEAVYDEDTDIFMSKKKLKKGKIPSYMDADTDIWY